MPRIKVSTLITEYLSHAPLRPVTRKQNGYHLRSISREFGRRNASGINCADMTFFVEKEQKRGLALSTIATRVRIFKAAIHWGIRTGRLQSCQIDEYRLPKIRPRRTTPPNREELRAMLAKCPAHLERAIKIGWRLGPRIGPSELFSLRWDDVDLTAGIIRMPNAAKGARCESRELPVPKELLREMKNWKMADGDCSWVINWRGKKIIRITRAFESARKNAGIERGFTPYSLRHAFATQAIAHGAPLKGVCAVMGHGSPRMVLEVYQHLDFDIIRKTIQTMPRL